MQRWTSHLVPLRETVFSGYFVNRTPLRVGVGREPPLGYIELAVIKINYRGKLIPYIPGSSLKGAFRNCATVLANSKGVRACSGLSKETCMDTIEVRGEAGPLKLSRYVDLKLREGKAQEAMSEFWKRACLLCKVFGSPAYEGNVSFSDAYPIDETGEVLPFSLGTRPGIAIDRRTGAVFKRALYTVEYVAPGAKFRFSIRCHNLPNYALGLLAEVLRMVHGGQVRLGGFKTRGFGTVRVEGLEFVVRDFPPEGTVMKALEEGVDEPVDLSGLAELRNGNLVARGDRAWEALNKLEVVWDRAASKIAGAQRQA